MQLKKVAPVRVGVFHESATVLLIYAKERGNFQ
jgi:hypothetical protein